MADTKISELNPLTGADLQGVDLLPIVDSDINNDGNLTDNETKSISIAELRKTIISVNDNGGDGSLSYDTGVISYIGPSAAETRAHFSGGTGVLISDGEISIGQPVGTGDNVEFNQVTAALVGIGTTSPGERLEIRKDIDNDYVRLKLNNEGADGGASIFFNEGATTHASIFATYGNKSFNIKNGMPNGTLELQTTNSSGTTNDGLIIDGDSNVSIPNGSLTVKESINVGDYNTINGNNSLAVGLGNTTNRSGNYALGDRNEVGHPNNTVGGNSTAIGSDNVLYGGNSFVAGNNNIIIDVIGANSFESSSIVGNNNNISGSLRASIFGQNNTITNANDSVSIGKGSNLTGNNSIALGTGLNDAGDNNTVILGRYNADPGDSSKIVIGAGFSDTARYSAIEVESKTASMRARSKLIFRSLMDTNSYADDSAAAAAGVVLGELYRDGNTVKIRMT